MVDSTARIVAYSTRDKVTVLESAQSNTIDEFRSTITLIDDPSSYVPIGIEVFNKDTDSLLVFANSVYIERGEDYTTPDNLFIQKVIGSWASGTKFNFIVTKKNLFTGAINGGTA